MTESDPSEDKPLPLPDDLDPSAFRGQRGVLERGWRRTWLIHRVAQGDASDRELGRQLGVNKSSITKFRNRNQAEIEDVRLELADRLDSLWVADKVNRLAEIQQDIEDLNTLISKTFDPPEPGPLDPGPELEPGIPDSVVGWIRAKQVALRNAAEELGQIPNRVTMNMAGGVQVSYRIEGVDLDAV